MPESAERALGRRAVLGGAAAGIAGTLLTPASAWAGGGPPPQTVDAVASGLDQQLIDLRRDLHAHPELAGAEQRTAEVVARHLHGAGLHVTTGVGGTGLLALLTGDRPGRTVAYRGDLDAVPPNAQFGGPGVAAHLCGHDLHTTIGVGTALVLARLRHRLAGRVLFVFQPGEENLTGAAAMLADGVFDRVRPTEIHALHCGPWPVGHFAVTPGVGMPGQDHGTVTLTGPDAAQRADRLVEAIGALRTVALPVTHADIEQLYADLMTPHGPLERFVNIQARASTTAEGAQVLVTSRCWPERRWIELRRTVHRLAAAAGASSVQFQDEPFPALVTPIRDGLALRHHLNHTIGRERTEVMQAAIPFNGEDFSLFLDRIPGTYTFLGVRRPGWSLESAYPHFGAFDPDERAIGHGVRAMARWLSTRTAAG